MSSDILRDAIKGAEEQLVKHMDRDERLAFLENPNDGGRDRSMIGQSTLDALKEIRDRLDVGGEQSRAFKEEIEIANEAIAEAEKPYAERVCATCQAPEGEHGSTELTGALCPGQREDFCVFMPKAEDNG